MTLESSGIFGNSTPVFYIYAPRWSDASAGIRALHYLCHALNKIGYDSYLVFSDSSSFGHSPVSPKLMTPILDSNLSRQHQKAGRNPITIYSETIPGNPLNAPFTVRYLLNYVGSLGGQREFFKDDCIISYSANIAEDYARITGADLPKVLFLPPVDPREFTFKTDGRENFYLLYAGKYRAFVGTPPKILGKDTVEILRTGKNAQSRTQVIDLLSKCRAVISFENSSIITEAILSGAPGLFYPNKFLGKVIAEQELGWAGTAYGISDDDEIRATSSLSEGRDNYLELVRKFPLDLTDLAEHLVRSSATCHKPYRLTIPQSYGIVSKHRLNMSRQLINNLGWRAWLRVLFNFLRRRLRSRF